MLRQRIDLYICIRLLSTGNYFAQNVNKLLATAIKKNTVVYVFIIFFIFSDTNIVFTLFTFWTKFLFIEYKDIFYVHRRYIEVFHIVILVTVIEVFVINTVPPLYFIYKTIFQRYINTFLWCFTRFKLA